MVFFYDLTKIIQVTPTVARLVQADNRALICEWKPPGDRRISVVTCNSSQLICASACDIYYIELNEGQLTQIRFAFCLIKTIWIMYNEFQIITICFKSNYIGI